MAKMDAKRLSQCFYKAGYYTVMHDGIEHAGYLAFLGLLSLFPFLVFFIGIAGVIGESATGAELIHSVISLLPEDVIAALMPRIDEILNGPPQGLLTLAIIGVIWTASSAVEGTRTILNRAYRVETPPAYIWRRLLSIAQFLGLTAACIIAMFLLIFVPVVWSQLEHLLGFEKVLDPVWTNVRLGFGIAILFLVVAISYYTLPNIKQSWVRVVPGTIIVVLLWLFAVWVFTSYLKTFDQVNLVYGSLGGVIVALLFFYILGVIYIFGAEFNYFYERAIGHRIVQKEKVPDGAGRDEDANRKEVTPKKQTAAKTTSKGRRVNTSAKTGSRKKATKKKTGAKKGSG